MSYLCAYYYDINRKGEMESKEKSRNRLLYSVLLGENSQSSREKTSSRRHQIRKPSSSSSDLPWLVPEGKRKVFSLFPLLPLSKRDAILPAQRQLTTAADGLPLFTIGHSEDQPLPLNGAHLDTSSNKAREECIHQITFISPRCSDWR